MTATSFLTKKDKEPICRETVKQFYSTVGQRTQQKEYKIPAIEEYHDLEEKYLRHFIRPGSRILEVGCGMGRVIDALYDLAQEITGIEYVPEVARKTAAKYMGLKKVRILVDDICDLSSKVADLGQFDYVLCMFNTFGTIPKEDRQAAIDNMYSLLNEEGVLIVSVYHKSVIAFQQLLYEKAGWTISEVTPDYIMTEEGLVSYRFERKELEELFERRGYDILVTHLTDISLILRAKRL